MTVFSEKLKKFLHDPIDKCLDILRHIERAKEYADLIAVSNIEGIKGPDWIASCMERSLLPKSIIQEFNEIRHPLSEEKIKIGEIDKDNIFNSVKNAFEEIGKEIKFWDEKKRFLYLWRNLIEVVSQKLNDNPLKKYISVLPADTRIPDHSIWEHLKITAAIDAFENIQNNSLFLFSIGPVQSFIQQARKAQDLFMGSFLLSYLSFIATKKIIEDYGPTNIIYPDLFSQPLMDFYLEDQNINVKNSCSAYVHRATIPNRFVAIIPLSDKNEIGNLAESITKKVKNEWKNITHDILTSFGLNIDETFIKKQIDDFPETYWVAIPFRKGDKDIHIHDLTDFLKDTKEWQDLWEFAKNKGEFSPNIGLLYQALYTSLEKSIGARKNLRDFKPTEEEGKKCHLCGEREGRIKKDTGNLRVGKFISDNEGLCVLCFTKRAFEKYLEKNFGNLFKDFNFPSTAEVALTDFKQKALTKAQEEFKGYIETFKSVVGEKFKELIVNPLPRIIEKFKDIENLEGEWFFAENLTESMFKKQLGIKANENQTKELKDRLKKLSDEVGENPNPYFAIIMLDADNMGRWLAGELLPKIEFAYNSDVWKHLPVDFKNELVNLTKNKKILTPSIHSAISTALRNYSVEFVGKIVEEEHYGKLIYSGGDDVLAFVNINDLFEVMRKLRASFSGHIKIEDGRTKVDWTNNSGFVEKDGRLILTMGKNATASCGVLIAHYKTPLKIVMDKVRELERRAKQGEKDAFAIGFLRHSGEERIGRSRWRCGEIDVLGRLMELAQVLKKKDNKPWISIKFIYNLNKEFERLKREDGHFTGMGDIFGVELKRLLERASHGKKDEKKKMVNETSEILKDIFRESGGNIDNFVNLLEITAFVSKAEE